MLEDTKYILRHYFNDIEFAKGRRETSLYACTCHSYNNSDLYLINSVSNADDDTIFDVIRTYYEKNWDWQTV